MVRQRSAIVGFSAREAAHVTVDGPWLKLLLRPCCRYFLPYKYKSSDQVASQVGL